MRSKFDHRTEGKCVRMNHIMIDLEMTKLINNSEVT